MKQIGILLLTLISWTLVMYTDRYFNDSSMVQPNKPAHQTVKRQTRKDTQLKQYNISINPVYDFVEIGTSNFNTILQKSTRDSRGISVDAMQIYLDNLPSLPNVLKLNLAVVGLKQDDNQLETMEVFFVSPGDIEQHKLPDWIRGCNSVGKPHPTTLSVLKESNLEHLMKNKTVVKKDIYTLFLENNVCRTKVLKIDVEGLDAELLLGYVRFLWSFPQCFADKIAFEINELTDPSDRNAAILGIESVGYKIKGDSIASGFEINDETRIYSSNMDIRQNLLKQRHAIQSSNPLTPKDKISNQEEDLLIVHFVWVKPYLEPETPEWNELPTNVITEWTNVIKKLPYKVMLWNSSLIKEHFPELVPMLTRIKTSAWISDIVRYHALSKFGGLYMDTDERALRDPSDIILENHKLFAVCEIPAFEYHGYSERDKYTWSSHTCTNFANGIIAVPRGHSSIECAAIRSIENSNILLNENRGFDHNLIGPPLWTSCAKQFPDVNVLPTWTFLICPFLSDCKKSDYENLTYAIGYHEWKHSWW